MDCFFGKLHIDAIKDLPQDVAVAHAVNRPNRSPQTILCMGTKAALVAPPFSAAYTGPRDTTDLALPSE